MNCAHCGTGHQRGRYCIGCGKLMPPSPLPPRRVRLAPRPTFETTDDMTQPVLRFDVRPRRPMVPARVPADAG
ncbi:hypothetical protein DQ244_16080 [Blastococcus sp. TBT05-19]|uniref:hypothetical protein n=1 Tax=Blastococcus sp. TBT05-19 TaxID=2250581 RepID=UPI000DEA1CAD|nr:hypothetical protein [Blastococcus sp. TBT05-19]RBY88076.1 hypothetical protein DQ244_16080 [Blastococcus sp. TBT05-19]